MCYIPISCKLSNAQQPVVPKVVETKKGCKPFWISSSIACLKICPLKLQNQTNNLRHLIICVSRVYTKIAKNS